MTIGRRIIGSISGMLALMLALAGLGLGLTIWLRSWQDDFTARATQTGALSDAGLQGMLRTLDSRAIILLVLILIVLALGLGLGVTALLRLGPTVDRRLKGTVSGIGGSVSGLLSVSAQMADAASRTSSATHQTTASVEELKQTMMLAAEKAAEASELSDIALKGSKHGGIAARKNQEHFELIEGGMDTISSAMSRLQEQVQSVEDIMTMVSEIAEQSNVLSVNASIEAAKAGDAGRGFTVVAQEVKSLAAQSKQAVGQVKAVLGEVQKAKVEVIRAIEDGREISQRGSTNAGQALASLDERVGVSSRAAEAALQISAASSQQLAGIDQISQAIISIDEAGRQSLASSSEVEREVNRLQELALDLDRLVGASVAD